LLPADQRCRRDWILACSATANQPTVTRGLFIVHLPTQHRFVLEDTIVLADQHARSGLSLSYLVLSHDDDEEPLLALIAQPMRHTEQRGEVIVGDTTELHLYRVLTGKLLRTMKLPFSIALHTGWCLVPCERLLIASAKDAALYLITPK
jgi:hypothetical protein